MAIDKRIKEGCPFCGTPFNLIQIYINRKENNWNGKNQGYYTRITCPNLECEATISGFGVMNTINRWNRRFYP